MRFIAQNHYGVNELQRILEALPVLSRERVPTVARCLHVSPSTVKNWLAGRVQPPAAAVMLLWHESPEGRQYADVMSGNVAANLAAQVDSLRYELARVQARADALAVELAEVKAAAAAACPPLPIAANERFF